MRACGDAQTPRARRDASRASASRATVGVWAAASVSLLFAVVVSSQRLPPTSAAVRTKHVPGHRARRRWDDGDDVRGWISQSRRVVGAVSYFDAATQTSETDVVPATFINFGTISFVTPSRKFARGDARDGVE